MRKPGKPVRSGKATRVRDDAPPRAQTIPVVQEEASVSRVLEKTGTVRVRIASHEERQQVPVDEIFDEVTVERVPINRYVSERTGPREEGGVVIIPVFETVPVVEQRLVLKEEVRIVRQRREVRRQEEVVVRREEAIVERRAADLGEWSRDPGDA